MEVREEQNMSTQQAIQCQYNTRALVLQYNTNVLPMRDIPMQDLFILGLVYKIYVDKIDYMTACTLYDS